MVGEDGSQAHPSPSTFPADWRKHGCGLSSDAKEATAPWSGLSPDRVGKGLYSECLSSDGLLLLLP